MQPWNTPSPDCRCKEAHLFFWGAKEEDGKKVIDLCFHGGMTLRGRISVGRQIVDACFRRQDAQGTTLTRT